MEWCQDVMIEEMKTLKRLHRLQTTNANLPTEKVHLFFVGGFYPFIMSVSYVEHYLLVFPSQLQVLSKIRNYLQLLGLMIDQIVLEHEEEPYKQDSMCFIHVLNIF